MTCAPFDGGADTRDTIRYQCINTVLWTKRVVDNRGSEAIVVEVVC